MEATNVDPLNGGLSQFYVIVAFTRRPSVLLCIQGVSDWNQARTHDIVACHLCRLATCHFSIRLCIHYTVIHIDRELHALCMLYLPVITFTIRTVGITTSYGQDGTVFKSWQRQEILLSSKLSRPAVRSTQPLFNGYWNFYRD
jgi:hypothetical protein